MILRSLAEFGAVLLAGGVLIIFGGRVMDGRSEFNARGKRADEATAASREVFHQKAGLVVRNCGFAMIATTVVMLAIWAPTRSDLVIAANWLIAALWIFVLGFVATKAAKDLEFTDSD